MSNADERARFEEVLAGVEHPRVGDVRAVWRRAADALPDLPPPEAGPHDGGGYFLGWNYTYAPALTLTVIFPAAGGVDWFYRDKALAVAMGTEGEADDATDPQLPEYAFALLRVFALAKRLDETEARADVRVRAAGVPETFSGGDLEGEGGERHVAFLYNGLGAWQEWARATLDEAEVPRPDGLVGEASLASWGDHGARDELGKLAREVRSLRAEADEGPRLERAAAAAEEAARAPEGDAAVLALASALRETKKRHDFAWNALRKHMRRNIAEGEEVKRYKRALASSMRMLREARADVGAAKKHRVVLSEAEWAEVARVLDSPPEPSPKLRAARRAARERIASPLGWGATPARVALWQAVNAYAAACGGDTSDATVSGARMDAVVAVDRAVEGLHLRAADEVMRICEARPPTEPVAPVPEHVMRYGREVVAARIAHGICPRATCARHDGHEGPHASDDELRAAYAGPAASLPSDPSWGTCDKCARGEDHPQDGHCDLCNRVGRPLTDNTCDECAASWAARDRGGEGGGVPPIEACEVREPDSLSGVYRVWHAGPGSPKAIGKGSTDGDAHRDYANKVRILRLTSERDAARAELRGVIDGNGGEHPAWMAARHKYEQRLEHAEREARDRLACLRELYASFGPLDEDGCVGAFDEINLRQMRELVAEAIGPEACAEVARENDWPGAEGGGDGE